MTQGAPIFHLLSSATLSGLAGGGGAIILIGIALWLAGSRFSQGLVTLAAVATGAATGKQFPAWIHSTIDPIGTCFGGAFVLGLLGYLYHRMWVGVGLGLLAATWAAIVTWLLTQHNQPWSFPTISFPLDLAALAKSLWATLPADLHKTMPWAVGGSALATMTLAAICPRIASRLFYSMLGISIIALAGALLPSPTINVTHLLTSGSIFPLAAAAILVWLGMMAQWWIAPKRLAIPSDPPPAGNAQPNS
ncbi:MAG TPA: hypothetical protein VFE58_07090 [Tepidisphaeraceae bacterium]|nr:hypothetical protein [Tepidisphaeraceae bacterium]